MSRRISAGEEKKYFKSKIYLYADISGVTSIFFIPFDFFDFSAGERFEELFTVRFRDDAFVEHNDNAGVSL